MRILRIQFENLNSLLSGDIDLEHGPLAEAGIFAITGPTGALKITLNDAGLVKTGLNYSVGAPRQDEAQWVAAPDLTTGANVNPVVVQIV